MMFIYKTAKFAPVWTTFLKLRVIFAHQTFTEHALLGKVAKFQRGSSKAPRVMDKNLLRNP